MSFTPEEEAELRILLGITNKTVSDLELAPTLAGDMLMEVESGSGTFSSSIDNLKTYIAPPATKSVKGSAFLSNPITISNNATDPNNDIDFSAGNIQFSDNSGQATYAGGTGQLDVLFGTGNGMLATGTKAINSTYHLYMVSNLTTGVSKPLAILGIAGTAPNPTSVLPSGYTKFSFKGSITTDASGNIRSFKMKYISLNSASFIYSTNITAFNGTSPTLNTDLTLTVPAGREVGAIFSGTLAHSGAGYLIYYLKSKIQGDNIVSGTIGDVGATRSSITPPFPILTNSSAQIQHGRDASGGSAGVVLLLHGWIDNNLN